MENCLIPKSAMENCLSIYT